MRKKSELKKRRESKRKRRIPLLQVRKVKLLLLPQRSLLARVSLRNQWLMYQNLRSLKYKSGLHRLGISIWLKDLLTKLPKRSWMLLIRIMKVNRPNRKLALKTDQVVLHLSSILQLLQAKRVSNKSFLHLLSLEKTII
jgi:hypothetical protein